MPRKQQLFEGFGVKNENANQNRHNRTQIFQLKKDIKHYKTKTLLKSNSQKHFLLEAYLFNPQHSSCLLINTDF